MPIGFSLPTCTNYATSAWIPPFLARASEQRHLGPIFAIAQTVARPSMRPLASAIILLTATCFGQGVGPLTVGIINDALKNDYGTDAVRYSLLSAAVTTTLGALLSLWAARSIRDDIRWAS